MIPRLLGLFEAQSDTNLDGWLGQLLQGQALRQTANKGTSLPTRWLETGVKRPRSAFSISLARTEFSSGLI